MRAIQILAILLITGPAIADPLEAPEINMFPQGLPGQSFELVPDQCVEEAGTFLTKPRAEALNAQIDFMFRYRSICQSVIDVSIEPPDDDLLMRALIAIASFTVGGLVVVAATLVR